MVFDGVPIYKKSLKNGSPILDLICETDKNALLEAWNKDQYTKALEILGRSNIISMRYAFEVDLVICQSYCDAFCTQLRVREEDKNAAYLLKNQGNVIKKYMNINAALDEKGTQNLPKSYRRILNAVRDMIQ